jgi:SpoVK/Ycf46/Vps4 family AAA+-type ATPase
VHHSFCKSGVELAGATSSGQTASGVTAHVFGSLLTRLNDRESDVFFVGTCNDASRLPPEFARAQRFDGVFFVDLPARVQKDAIWGIDTRSTRQMDAGHVHLPSPRRSYCRRRTFRTPERS